MKSSNSSEAQKALDRAKEAINSAVYNFEGAFFLVTANRAYYAVYYCMTALLYTVEVYAKTHQGTHRKFAEHFIKPGLFPVKASETVNLLFDYRQAADYEFEEDLSAETAEDLIAKAKEFLQLTLRYFEKLNQSQ